MLSLFCYAPLCVLSSFAIILKRKKAGFFAVIVLQMYCYYKCYVALPHGTVRGLQCVIVVFLILLTNFRREPLILLVSCNGASFRSTPSFHRLHVAAKD